MTTISPNRRRRGSYSGLFITVVLFVVVVVLVVLLRSMASNLFWKVLSPLVALRNEAQSGEVASLESQLASTTAALADRDALYQQNVQLKQLLGRSTLSHTTLGAVLERPPGIPYDTLIIDIGKNKGVAEGALVFAGGPSAVGTISDVYDTTSRVSLFSAPGESYQATLEDGTPVTLSGEGAGSMSGEVPAGTTVTTGESVILPGALSAFLGSVSYIQEESGASFETIYVQLPVNLFSLQYVEVQTQ
jgi:cell shape-determining protein MreC